MNTSAGQKTYEFRTAQVIVFGMDGKTGASPERQIILALQKMQEMGYEAGVCLDGTDINPLALVDPLKTVSISLNQEFRFYRNILALTGDPQLGLTMGRAYSFESFGLLGYALTSASTVKHALKISRHYGLLAFSLFTLDFRIVSEEFGYIILRPSDKIPQDLLAYYIDRSISFIVNTAQVLLLPSFVPEKIVLMHQGPTETYEQFFCCPVESGGEVAEIHGNKTILNTPMPQPDDEINRLCRQQCEVLLSRMSHADSYSDRIRQLIVKQPGYFPSIEQVAESLSMTSRTLRRKLSGEETSFKEIIDDIRCQQALDYLSNKDLLIEEIAILLGYSSAGNFTHAFRRWKGCSPKDYRNAAL